MVLELPAGSVTVQRKAYAWGNIALLTERMRLIPVGFPSCVRPGTDVRVNVSPAPLAVGRLPSGTEPRIKMDRRTILGVILDNLASGPRAP